MWCLSHVTYNVIVHPQYPQEKNNGPKVPVELRVNIWLGLSAVEKKFNSFAEGAFTVFAEMVSLMTVLSSHRTPSFYLPPEMPVRES